MKILRISSAQVKIQQIHVIFETINQFFFEHVITLQCEKKQIFDTFLAEILYTFNKRSLLRYKFCEISAIGSLKFCTLMGSFCPNHIKFQLNKVQKSYLSWHWRVLKSLKKNWLVVSTQKSKNFTSMGPFCSMYMRFDLNKCGGIIFHDSKNSEIWALMGYFCRAYVIFEVNKIEEFCREKWLMVSKMT